MTPSAIFHRVLLLAVNLQRPTDMTSLAENCFFEPRASEQPGFTPVHGI